MLDYDDLTGLLEFIEQLPDGAEWVHFDDSDGMWHITNEWLCGTFAGRSFPAKTKIDSLMDLVDYFDRHINHKSVVGSFVTESGWPNLKRVKEYVMLDLDYEDML